MRFQPCHQDEQQTGNSSSPSSLKEPSVEHENLSSETNTAVAITMEVEYNLQDEGGVSSHRRRPFFFRYLPRLVRFDDAPIDATGCSVDMFARSTVFMASIFLGPALLELASKEALQICQNNNNYDNNNNIDDTIDTNFCETNARVHGFKPSSLLSNIAIVGYLLSTIFLPIFGAIVDHTPYRRHVGAWTAFGLAVIKGLETILLSLSISQSLWFFIAILQTCSLIFFQLHIVAAYAYSAELSSAPNTQSQYQTHFFTSMYVSMILYMLEVLIPGTILGFDDNDIATAQWAVTVTTITSVPLFYMTWGGYLFRDCPPIRNVPPDQSLWTTGFAQLRQTYTVLTKDRPAVAIFLRTMAFSEAANAALATIATTYMSEVLQMNGLEIGMTILIVLIFGLPGSWLGHYCTTYWYDNNPVASTKLCLIVYAITTAAACITLIEPSRKNWAYFYGAGWGVCQGWIHPQHTTIFVTITVVGDDGSGDGVGEQQQQQQQQQQSTTALSTGGQDDACHQASTTTTTTTTIPPKQQQGVVELMGVFLFACQILSFLPPLVFTALNEAGVSMQWGLASLVVYFVIGYVGLIQMGDYRSALLMMDRVVNNSNSSTTLAQNHDHHYHHNDINRSSNTSHDGGEDFKANNDLGGGGGGGGGGVLT